MDGGEADCGGRHVSSEVYDGKADPQPLLHFSCVPAAQSRQMHSRSSWEQSRLWDEIAEVVP